MNYLVYGQKCDGRTMVVEEPGALTGLVTALSANGKPLLQNYAARILGKLAKTHDESMKDALMNKAGILVGLRKAFLQRDNPVSQKDAARAITNLAASENDLYREALLNEDGVLGGLVNALSEGNCQVKKCGVRALEYLALSQDYSVRRRLVNEEGLLAGLIRTLDPDSCVLEEYEVFDPELLRLSTYAACAMKYQTATKDDSVLKRIQNESGLLESITSALVNSYLQWKAAEILGNLARAKDVSIKQNLTQEQSVIFGLVDCLKEEVNCNVQAAAAKALANLADAEDVSVSQNMVMDIVVGEWKLNPLSAFVKCLSAKNSLLRASIARALASLANTNDDAIKLRIATEGDMLAALAKSSSEDECPYVQQDAARALASPADAKDPCIKEVINQQFAVAHVVLLIHRWKSEDGEQAAWSKRQELSLNMGEYAVVESLNWSRHQSHMDISAWRQLVKTCSEPLIDEYYVKTHR